MLQPRRSFKHGFVRDDIQRYCRAAARTSVGIIHREKSQAKSRYRVNVMWKSLLSIFVFGAMTEMAMAGPMELSDAQMDYVAAGSFDNLQLTIYAPVIVNVTIRKGASTETFINVASILQFTFVESTSIAAAVSAPATRSSLAVAPLFGILTPNPHSTNTGALALSRAFGGNLARVLQQ